MINDICIFLLSDYLYNLSDKLNLNALSGSGSFIQRL